jgi:geranylgeranyl pyrophosphate synthase
MDLCRLQVERALDHWLPPAETPPARLHEAMRYSAIAGGKYIRPVLVYATGRIFGAAIERLDGPACAVELIHAYSLIHDDLPAMDNDALRRGKPCCHIAFGEAIAILAGDALQALAFHILASDPALAIDDRYRLKMIDTLSIAASSIGMAGGQAIDLASVGMTLDLDDLENMHLRKTGALIRASILLGALGADVHDDEALHVLGNYARCIGLAFQIRDDILDVEGDTATLGKMQGADSLHNKPTYVSLLGVDGARAMAMRLHDEAVDHLAPLGGRAALLRAIAAYIVERVH